MLQLSKLEDLDIQLIDGDRGENYPSRDEFYENEYCLFLDANNITSNGFDFSSTHFITKEKDTKLRNGKLQRNDIVIMTRGSVGNIALYDKSIKFPNIRINSGMLIIRCGKLINPLNVYYQFKSPIVIKQINDFMSGSVQKQLPVSILKEIKIFTCSKTNANFLKLIDDKIALNNKTNTELENMAKTIYDYWFTQFDFPDKDGHPYKTSGGQMVYNEILKREIPVGWEVGNLYNIAEYINGLACQNFRPKENESYLPVIKIREMHDGFSVDTEKVSSNIPDKYKIKNGDILFSWSATLETMIWVHGEGGLNQHIFKVVPKSYFSKEFVYQQLRQYIINFQMIALSRKTTMGHITSDHIEQSTITLPPREVIIQYTSSIKSIFDKSLQLQKENMELTKLRDYLLPLLMNGQVEVK